MPDDFAIQQERELLMDYIIERLNDGANIKALATVLDTSSIQLEVNGEFHFCAYEQEQVH